jgi:phosphoglycolate phosphatase
LDKLVTTYREVQKKLLQTEQEMEPLYPGITDMLENLKQKNYALGIVTSKARRILQGALDRNKITHYFASIKTPDDGPGKPDPFLLQQAMNENQFGPQETIYVGDTIFDMQAARAAKVQSLGVTWGYHMRKDLIDAGAHKIIERVDEISPAVTAWKLQA